MGRLGSDRFDDVTTAKANLSGLNMATIALDVLEDGFVGRLLDGFFLDCVYGGLALYVGITTLYGDGRLLDGDKGFLDSYCDYFGLAIFRRVNGRDSRRYSSLINYSTRFARECSLLACCSSRRLVS